MFGMKRVRDIVADLAQQLSKRRSDEEREADAKAKAFEVYRELHRKAAQLFMVNKVLSEKDADRLIIAGDRIGRDHRHWATDRELFIQEAELTAEADKREQLEREFDAAAADTAAFAASLGAKLQDLKRERNTGWPKLCAEQNASKAAVAEAEAAGSVPDELRQRHEALSAQRLKYSIVTTELVERLKTAHASEQQQRLAVKRNLTLKITAAKKAASDLELLHIQHHALFGAADAQTAAAEKERRKNIRHLVQDFGPYVEPDAAEFPVIKFEQAIDSRFNSDVLRHEFRPLGDQTQEQLDELLALVNHCRDQHSYMRPVYLRSIERDRGNVTPGFIGSLAREFIQYVEDLEGVSSPVQLRLLPQPDYNRRDLEKLVDRLVKKWADGRGEVQEQMRESIEDPLTVMRRKAGLPLRKPAMS